MTAKKVPISQLGKKIENLAKYAYRWGVWFILWMCFSRRTKEQIQLEIYLESENILTINRLIAIFK